MKAGMIGLGKMGGNMAARLREAGHEIVGYDPHSDASDVGSLAELVAQLGDGESPRVAWAMVPAGEPTESVVTELAGLLRPGDVIIDGGNSRWTDSIRRGEQLAAKSIGYLQQQIRREHLLEACVDPDSMPVVGETLGPAGLPPLPLSEPRLVIHSRAEA